MSWLLAAVVSGALALFSTYWDDSLHTDAGRDTFWSAPHVLLYGSILGTLAALACWGWSKLRRQGLAAAATDPLLRWAAASGAAVGIAAPADAAWHSAFGRDAVLWSPPHLLAIVATFALTATLLRAIMREGGTGLPAAMGGALVLAAALVPVMEYESDVPQFSTVWFLPVAGMGVTLAVVVLRRFDDHPWAVTRAALLVTAARLLMLPVLAGLGYSTPIVPPVVVVAVAVDVIHRRHGSAWWLPAAVPLGVHVAYVPLLPLMPHGAAVAAGQIAPSILLGVAGSALVVLAAEGLPHGSRRITQAGGVAALLGLLFAVPLMNATPARAHDPGQGAAAGQAQWNAQVRDDSIDVTLTTTGPALAPTGLIARRAGEELTGRLVVDADGVARGSISLRADRRWFLYATFRDGQNRPAETWIPVQRDSGRTIAESRPVYLPSAETEVTGKSLATVALYGMAAALLVAVARSGPKGLTAMPTKNDAPTTQ
ncbi:hypothetical protein OG304_04800 [Streptomyces sp. NBC_00160]|uniref:hypothetical protein n=1 Tax=Streptomyces sp. NBC_00160 TaxID=2903628 RepID=UPI00224DEC1B|nr:hypothetical protein [Streptomyces sp. NBC_00160]MCX5302771.1 hypothetical protein [Streptomyces sp. NBC_00160]